MCVIIKMMNATYTIVKDYNLLIQKYTGVFCFDEFFEYLKKVTADPEWQIVNKIITDLRDINLDAFYNDMDNFVKYRKENIKNSYVNVFIVNSPLSTVVVHLYKEKLNSKRYRYEYCSTIEYTLSLLGLEDKQKEIESIIEKL